MKSMHGTWSLIRPVLGLLALSASAALVMAPCGHAQNALDDIAVGRGLLAAGRVEQVAEAMRLTEDESAVFWPMYGEYRADMDKVNDDAVSLLKKYGEAYSDMTTPQAEHLLMDFLTLEHQRVEVRNTHLKRIAKSLGAATSLRLAQVEMRFEAMVRQEMAKDIPLVPTKSP